MTRLDKILGSLRKEDKIIEIGASYNPAAAKADGWNTRVLDHCTKAELIEKYRSLHLGTKHHVVSFDISRIEEVDYVWHGGALESAVPKEEWGTFDACIASHVIEHTPDLIGFIKSLEALLKPDGLISLAVPDKRYCFDYFQSLSTTGNILDAQGSSRHPRGKVFNATAYLTLQNQKTTWSPGRIGQIELSQNLQDCYNDIRQYQARPEEPYVDCHAWFFTPNSFRLIISELAQLRLINCHVHITYPTAGPEFFVTLKKGPAPSLSDPNSQDERLHTLLAIQKDLSEQLFYNPTTRTSWNWKLRATEFKAKLSDIRILGPLYEVYKYYIRDGSLRPKIKRDQAWWKNQVSNPWTILNYLVQSYHYKLTIGTSTASKWRHRKSTPIESTAHRVLKPLITASDRTVLFVTYHPQGFMSGHVRHFVDNFKRNGFTVILIKIVDDMEHPLADSTLPEADAVLVRKNAGHDFGAWAHAMKIFPTVYESETLWLVNDSIFGPATSALFDRMLDRINNSGADFVGLTESKQYVSHFQSYFVVFRNLSRHRETIRNYWSHVQNIQGRTNVIFEYELGMKRYFSSHGLRCNALFPVAEIAPGENPTFHSWEWLLKAGFPFIKVGLFKANDKFIIPSVCRDTFGRLGYDVTLIDQHLESARRKSS